MTTFSPGASPARLRIEAAGATFQRERQEAQAREQAHREWMRQALDRSAKRRAIVEKFDAMFAMLADTTRRSCMQIVKDVAKARGFSAQELLGASRNQNLVLARHEAMYLCSKSGKSYVLIGRIFGKDHTSVMHGVRKHAERLERLERMKGRAEEDRKRAMEAAR